MDIVKINLYAEAYYSEATYDEVVIISRDLYNKIEGSLDKYNEDKPEYDGEGISVVGLDGKYSEVDAPISVSEYKEFELTGNVWDFENSGGFLYCELKDMCKERNLDLDADIEAVKKYLDGIDHRVTFSVTAKKSNVEKIKEFIKSLD